MDLIDFLKTVLQAFVYQSKKHVALVTESPISDGRQPQPLELGQPDAPDLRHVAAEEPPIGRGK